MQKVIGEQHCSTKDKSQLQSVTNDKGSWCNIGFVHSVHLLLGIIQDEIGTQVSEIPIHKIVLVTEAEIQFLNERM